MTPLPRTQVGSPVSRLGVGLQSDSARCDLFPQLLRTTRTKRPFVAYPGTARLQSTSRSTPHGRDDRDRLVARVVWQVTGAPCAGPPERHHRIAPCLSRSATSRKISRTSALGSTARRTWSSARRPRRSSSRVRPELPARPARLSLSVRPHAHEARGGVRGPARERADQVDDEIVDFENGTRCVSRPARGEATRPGQRASRSSSSARPTSARIRAKTSTAGAIGGLTSCGTHGPLRSNAASVGVRERASQMAFLLP